MAGHVVSEVPLLDNCQLTVLQLKEHIEEKTRTQMGLQQILLNGELLDNALPVKPEAYTLVVTEAPLAIWDIAGNPDSDLLHGSFGEVTYISSDYDYVNVITKEPVRCGVHYFEFKMHKIGDEQWCGVSPRQARAGHGGGNAPGCFYYCGRRYQNQGALEAPRERHHLRNFQHVVDGDTIGMLLDADCGRIAFMLNGTFQGACILPHDPLFLSTCLDKEGDHVELLKSCLDDSPLSVEELRTFDLEALAVSSWDSSSSYSDTSSVDDSEELETDSD